MNIGVGYFVTEKVGEMEDNTREGRIKRTSKEVGVYVKAMAGKKNC